MRAWEVIAIVRERDGAEEVLLSFEVGREADLALKALRRRCALAGRRLVRVERLDEVETAEAPVVLVPRGEDLAR